MSEGLSLDRPRPSLNLHLPGFHSRNRTHQVARRQIWARAVQRYPGSRADLGMVARMAALAVKALSSSLADHRAAFPTLALPQLTLLPSSAFFL